MLHRVRPARPLELEKALNPDQIAAVTHGDGPQLVLAGAGSGKTRVITYRIVWLIEERGVDPTSIVAVTFTNKAAAEMRERVEDLLGVFPLPAFVGTFHRYALVLLRRYGERLGLHRDFAIVDTTDQLSLVKQALAAEGLDEKSFTPRAVLAAISGAKNRLVDPEQYAAEAQNFFSRRVAPVYRRYQGLLRSVAGVDFDDMISLAVRLLTTDAEIGAKLRARTRYLLVDEYQDTNTAQLQLIHALAGAEGNLTAVGDEDQGIYSWRGAEIENILNFERSFPGAAVRKLERNYRSTQNILDASGALVAHNEGRRGKRLWTDSGGGEAITLFRAADEGDEARWIVSSLAALAGRHSLAQMAILVRTNAQTRALEEELLRQEVPYVLVGGTRFYDRQEIKDLIAYLRVLRNPRDTLSLARILNTPPRGIGKSTEELVKEQAVKVNMPLWDLLENGDLGPLPGRGATALRAFVTLINGLRQAAQELPLPALLDRLLADTGYLDLYRKKGDDDSQARLENVQEFLSAAQELTESAVGRESEDQLTAFLDHVSLISDLDTFNERGLAVMTLHSAKGLEFDVVAVAGLEEGLLPHFNAQGGREDLEEERRLLYVGMTRARQRLLLSACRRRRIAGYYQDQQESPFVGEIPAELLTVERSPSLFEAPRAPSTFGSRAEGVYSFFGKERPAAEPAAPTPPLFATAPVLRSAPSPPAPARGAAAAPRALNRGSRVRHATLGPGVVLSLEGSGDQQKITVYFEKAGSKKLIAKYANLELE